MFTEKLLNWYRENGRQLPWRSTDNPYFIWLSEIILQQTRIEQGLDYYRRFTTQYPTVQHLAQATEEQVLKSWQGLGYYTRARNLHQAARQIVADFGGQFPSTYEGILSLRGVGRYTAAAIASFAFRLPYPVIDGNVYRLISRLYGIYTPIGTNQSYTLFEQRLLRLIDRERPDLFNQAIMDFGSLYCKPAGCDCLRCIFSDQCVACQQGKVSLLPVKQQTAKVKERFFYYIHVSWGDPHRKTLIHQRQAGDIWQGLYELPLLETAQPLPPATAEQTLRHTLKEWLGAEPAALTFGIALKHQLTHRTINAQFLQAKYHCQPPSIPPKMEIIDSGDIKNYPVSRLIDKYLSQM